MSGQRHCARPRCASCGLHAALCCCAARPQVSIPLQLLVIQHNREKNKPTNTVRPLMDVWENAKLIRYAVRGVEFDPSPLQMPGKRYALLFPGEDSVLLAPNAPDANDPASPADLFDVLVVLDGTWAQCSRMRHRVPGLSEMLCVALPASAPSQWGVRRSEDPARLSTFEAVARACTALGYERQGRAMSDYFAEVARRLLFMRGTIPVSRTNIDEASHRRYLDDVNAPREAICFES